MATKRIPCQWGYKYDKRGSNRMVNRHHRCNVSCRERWTLMRCLEWLRVTPRHIRGAETNMSRLVTKAELGAPVMVSRVGA
jgi:hypothetical protein